MWELYFNKSTEEQRLGQVFEAASDIASRQLSTLSFVSRKTLTPKMLTRPHEYPVPQPDLTRLIQEQEILGIVPMFWRDEEEQETSGPAILPLVPPN